MAYYDYTQLSIWQKSMDLTVEIYCLTKAFPKEELFALTSQMHRSVSSIPSNIAEGHGRFSPKDFLRFIKISHGSANELETQLEIAYRLGYITKETRSYTGSLIVELRRMLLGYAKWLETQDKTRN
ncbi:MAG: four helix bundle protein [Bacteroidales bacterium]|nr:four helix bundle protein [Bacteroidales bacterium]